MAKIGKTFNIEKDIDQLLMALEEANSLFQAAKKEHSLVSIDVSTTKMVNFHTDAFYRVTLSKRKK